MTKSGESREAAESGWQGGDAATLQEPGAVGTLEVFWRFLGLGCLSFGGPVAHLGYFRERFVERDRWLGDREYADLVAFCQFLPGPASSQVGMGIGFRQAGWRGLFAAWTGFTLPSAILMIMFALSLAYVEDLNTGWVRALELAAVAVVARACWQMGRRLCPDWPRRLMALVVLVLLLVPLPPPFDGARWQLVLLVVAALVGAAGLLQWGRTVELESAGSQEEATLWVRGGGGVGGRVAVVGFAILLVASLSLVSSAGNAELMPRLYRSGAMVFGGGHVVLPLLEDEVVRTDLVDEQVFLAGYGAAQGLPGPLFAFGAFVGAAANVGPGGVLGGLLALCALYLPSFLLVGGLLPAWESVRSKKRLRAALDGVNAAVVGLLLAALWDPVWVGSVETPGHVLVVVVFFVVLQLGLVGRLLAISRRAGAAASNG